MTSNSVLLLIRVSQSLDLLIASWVLSIESPVLLIISLKTNRLNVFWCRRLMTSLVATDPSLSLLLPNITSKEPSKRCLWHAVSPSFASYFTPSAIPEHLPLLSSQYLEWSSDGMCMTFRYMFYCFPLSFPQLFHLGLPSPEQRLLSSMSIRMSNQVFSLQ